MSSSPYAEAWLAGPENTQFYTRTYTPSSPAKAALVFIHGFAEHVGRYTDAHPQLAARGVAVFTFDQRGFGRTALDEEHASPSSAYGRTSGARQMADIEWAIAHTAQAFPGVPLFLAGHSMGGGEVLLFATRGLASNLKGVIACSPCILQTKPASKVQRWIGGKAALLTPYLAIPAPLNFAVCAATVCV
jgi:acylglycerol lipase